MKTVPSLGRIEAFVWAQLSSHDNPLAYHNIKHTLSVVENASRLADHYQLNDTDRFVVKAACWFHDLGYINGEPSGHEQRGVLLFQKFAEGIALDSDLTGRITGCILATRLPQKPADLVESIVCDADLYHFGTTEFAANDQLMLQETRQRSKTDISTLAWLSATMKLLQAHSFCTDYCQRELSNQKVANIRFLQHRIAMESRED